MRFLVVICCACFPGAGVLAVVMCCCVGPVRATCCYCFRVSLVLLVRWSLRLVVVLFVCEFLRLFVVRVRVLLVRCLSCCGCCFFLCVSLCLFCRVWGCFVGLLVVVCGCCLVLCGV